MTASTHVQPLSPIQKRLQMARQRQAARANSIAQRPFSPTAPLSFAQERQWLVEQLTPGDPANNRPTALRLHGHLDKVALQRSLNWLIQRHEPLRTTFPAVDGELEALIAEATAVPLNVHALQTLPAAEREEAARRQIATEARRPFDLESGAPVRVNLWQLAPTEHLLLLNVHHINFDGWSEGILRDELTACYKALTQDNQPALPPLPVTYSDFAHWQRQQATKNAWAADLAYWREQLRGNIPELNLPVDLMDTAVPSSGDEQTIYLPLDLVARLQTVGQQHEATLFMVLLAGYKLLLYRLTEATDVTVGVPVAGRNRVELEGLIGLFVNMIVLRSDMANNPTFADFLQALRQTTLAGLSHQAMPFAQLIEALQPARNLQRPPFYQTVFQLRNYRTSQTSDAAGLQFEPYAFAMNAAAVDLSLDAVLQQGGLQVRARYRADRFSSPRIANLLDQYRHLLTQIAHDPDALIGSYVVNKALFSVPKPSAPTEPTQRANGRIHTYQPPQTPLQKGLAALWADLLPVPRVGLHQNFFALGGHSLLGTRLLARIRQQLQVELSLTALFESPTVAELAERIAADLPEGQAASPVPSAKAETIQVEESNDKFLSPVQERLWFLEQLEPGKSALQIPLVVRLQGQLNVAALQQALEAIVVRHAPLRTTFALVDGQPTQQIAPTMPAQLTQVSLDDVPASQRETAVSQQIQALIKKPFDLAYGPLFRAALLRLNEAETIFVLTIHHIISDGWSLRVLARELSELYNGIVAERPSSLPPLPIQYNDFAAWQRQQLESDQLKAKLAYWQKQLADAPPILELPTDFSRPAVRTTKGASVLLTVPATTVNSLRQLSLEMDATLFMVLLAAFKLLLHCQSGQDDLVVGTPIAGRTHAEVEALIGFFINTLPLRTQFADELTFRELAQQVRNVTLEAYANQELPFERLLEEIKPERDMSRTPVFQVFFNMLNIEAHSLPLAGLRSERLPWFSQDANFDLTLYLREQDEGDIDLRLVYNTDLFSAERMEIFLEQYRLLMVQIADNASLPIQEYTLLTPETKLRLPDPAQPLPNQWQGAIHERVTEQTAVLPNKIALIDEDDAWRYGELEARSNQLAHHLQAQGIGAEDVVAIYAHRSASLIWAILGVFKAGAAYTILDPAYPAERLVSYVQTAKPKGLIQLTQAGALPAEVSLLCSELVCRVELPRLATAVANSFLAHYPITPPEAHIQPDSLALVTFTSGSTGKPKGVMGRHGPLSHFLPWQTKQFGLTTEDRFSMLSGLSHDPLQRDIFTALWVGGTLCIPSQELIGTPGRLAAWMAERAITFAHMTPPMAQLLTETAVNKIPSLRHTFFVGDKLTQEDVRRLRHIAPHVTAINSYGSTETQRAVTYYLVTPEDEQTWHKAVYPLGTGMVGVQILVLNKNQQLAGVGEAGEIYMRSHHLARGYLGDKPLTEARFLHNPFTNTAGDRLYRTGDLGRYLPDGRAIFAGRADRQVKIRGFRIEPGEIEAALLAHTAVHDAVVVTTDAPQVGPALAAYIVAPQSTPTTELRTFLQQRLPDFMVPAVFVFVATIPLTPNGKINYKALPKPDWQPLHNDEAYTPPRDEIEQQMAKLWQDLLSVEPIGVFDDFFALGGHSLLAVRLFAQIEKQIGHRLPIATLFQHPNIAQLAEIVRQQEVEQGWSALVPIKPDGSRSPFFCVHGGAGHVFNYHKLAGYLDADQPFYGVQPSGWNAHRVQVPDVKQLAASYLAEIRRLQPTGPYYLGGFCFGGMIVFEMARQLQEVGEEVALLALIEPAAAKSREALWRSANPIEIGSLFEPGRKAMTPFWKQVKQGGARFLLQMVQHLAKSMRQLKRGVFALYLMSGFSVPHHLRDFYLIQFVTRPARKAYRPASSFEGDVQLLVIDRGEMIDPTLGWRQYISGAVGVCEVDTDHLGILKEPHVQVVAEELQHQLDLILKQP